MSFILRLLKTSLILLFIFDIGDFMLQLVPILGVLAGIIIPVSVFIWLYFEGVGLLVMALGVGMVTAGYIYPNTGEEITEAVEKFEEN